MPMTWSTKKVNIDNDQRLIKVGLWLIFFQTVKQDIRKWRTLADSLFNF